jgi:hypothetical protein
VKNQLIRDRYAALSVLAQRTLPSPTAINKVSTLLATRFAPAFEMTEKKRKLVISMNRLPEGHDGDRLPIAIAEQRQAEVDAMLEDSTPVKLVPDRLRLTEADLPRVLKGEDGWKNAEGLASIRVMLGSLYVRSDEEKKLDDASSEAQEPDELAPAPEPDGFTPEAAE